jgi:hypothetical protein
VEATELRRPCIVSTGDSSDVRGRVDLSAAAAPSRISFEGAADADLPVKTSERRSIRVHPPPNRPAHGLPRGRDEAWYMAAEEPGPAIGISPPLRVPAEPDAPVGL